MRESLQQVASGGLPVRGKSRPSPRPIPLFLSLSRAWKYSDGSFSLLAKVTLKPQNISFHHRSPSSKAVFKTFLYTSKG